MIDSRAAAECTYRSNIFILISVCRCIDDEYVNILIRALQAIIHVMEPHAEAKRAAVKYTLQEALRGKTADAPESDTPDSDLQVKPSIKY